MRGALEDPLKTAALITPDRALARRVAAACRRWDIVLDDSSGQTLDKTSLGSFLRLIVQAASDDYSPSSLLALLKHEFSACNRPKGDFARQIGILEKSALRGLKPAPGIAGILDKIEDKSAPAATLLRSLEPVLHRFNAGSGKEKYSPFNDLIKIHLTIAEDLATRPGQIGADILWTGESGEAASLLFAELMEYGGLIPALTLQSYGALLEIFMKTIVIRPAYGTHPRLKILGQLEARLNDADLIIMGGLNEGTWPSAPGHDPWMSRPMRGQFGLPAAERSIGLAAHDFVQGFCAQHVVITRSARTGGAPAVPSRWLQRLGTVLHAAKLENPSPDSLLAWAAAMDASSDSVKPYTRPEPRPPVAKRPRKLAATRIETWMRDPYSLYARYVLNLVKLEPIEKLPDAAERGKLLHNILHQFVAAYPVEIPSNAEEILQNIAAQELQKFHGDPAAWSFWRPRFARLAAWLVAHEKEWRKNAKFQLAENEGEIALPETNPPFFLKARPDRIDRASGGPAVIDYKSGGTWTKSGIGNGDKPQLALEALILKHGGFKGLPPQVASSLAYWVLTGGAEPGKIISVEGDIDAIIETTENGLRTLVAAFDHEATPYYSLPRAARAPEYNDYEHLARVLEWTVLGDNDAEAA
jgi:ATP-dependent helicase/nuclease subunit B